MVYPYSQKPVSDMESTAVYALGSIFAGLSGDEVLLKNFWTECLSLW